MNRLLAVALSLAGILGACRVEPTPSEFFDQQRQVPTERELAADELSERLALLAAALSRADASGALATLVLTPGAFVIGPEEPELRSGTQAALEALERITAAGPVEMIIREMRVSVGPRASMAWFAAHLEPLVLPEEGEAPKALRMTGVFARPEGFWQVVQLHMSYPAAAASASPHPAALTAGALVPLLAEGLPARGSPRVLSPTPADVSSVYAPGPPGNATAPRERAENRRE